MSTPNDTTTTAPIAVGTRVRITSPTVRDYTLLGVVTGVQHGASFFVRLDDGTMSGPYGASELEPVVAPTSAFTTIRVDDILDSLVEALDLARVNAGTDRSWQNAISTGANWLIQQDAVEFDFSTHALKVPSASSPDLYYVSNGSCQCAAFSKHSACWHRASARLIRRALELELAHTSPFVLRPPTAQEPAPKPSAIGLALTTNELIDLRAEVYEETLQLTGSFGMAHDASKAVGIPLLAEVLDFAEAWDANAAWTIKAQAQIAENDVALTHVDQLLRECPSQYVPTEQERAAAFAAQEQVSRFAPTGKSAEDDLLECFA